MITVNVAGYKRATITQMPRKAQGPIELDVRLEPVVSGDVLAAGLGASDGLPYTRTGIILIGCLGVAAFAKAQPTAPSLEILRPANSNGWVRINSSLHSNAVLTLEGSTNLMNWSRLGTLHDALFKYPDARNAAMPATIQRARSVGVFHPQPYHIPGAAAVTIAGAQDLLTTER